MTKTFDGMTAKELSQVDVGGGTLEQAVFAFFYDECESVLDKRGITKAHWNKVEQYIAQGMRELYPNPKLDCTPNQDYLSPNLHS